jgi:hypothetical protein
MKSSWKRHVLTKHGGGSRKVKCEWCDYEGRDKSQLKRHFLLKHANPDDIQWFECGHCDYKAKQKSSLKAHLLAQHPL